MFHQLCIPSVMAALQSPKLSVGVRVPGGTPYCQYCCNEREKKVKLTMYKIMKNEVELDRFLTLSEAMEYSKSLGVLVTIEGNGMEIVGIFGADSIKDGKCPDGVDYTWMKRRSQ